MYAANWPLSHAQNVAKNPMQLLWSGLEAGLETSLSVESLFTCLLIQ